jgi:hypothetical protein
VDDVDLDAVAAAGSCREVDPARRVGGQPAHRRPDREARRGVVGDHDQGALVDEVRERHRDETDDAIRAAVRRQREELDAFVASPAYAECAGLPVASMLGTLPLLTFLHAATYPLATSALDLERCGAVAPDELVDRGLLGLVDTRRPCRPAGHQRASWPPPLTTVVGDRCARRLLAHDRRPPRPTRAGAGHHAPLDITAGRADVPGALARRDYPRRQWPAGLAPIAAGAGDPWARCVVVAIRAANAVAPPGGCPRPRASGPPNHEADARSEICARRRG